jgi:two-component system nitrate/nitrite response regulator NarL
MRVLIADDHPFTLQGTKSFIESFGYLNIRTFSNGIAAWNCLKIENIDLAILDINMPGMDGLDLAKCIFEKKLDTKVILVTMHNEIVTYRKAMDYNVYGYILKEEAHIELKKCLMCLKNGKIYESNTRNFDMIIKAKNSKPELDNLSLAEIKILELIAKQKTTKEIAELLFLSAKTIEGYRTAIIEKLNLPKEKNILLKYAMVNFKN